MKELSTYILNLRIEQYFTIDKEIDDVCYTIFECEKCKQNKIEVTLLPIVDKIIGNEHQLSVMGKLNRHSGQTREPPIDGIDST